MLLHVFSPFSEVSFLNVKVQNVIKMYTYFSSHFAQTSKRERCFLITWKVCQNLKWHKWNDHTLSNVLMYSGRTIPLFLKMLKGWHIIVGQIMLQVENCVHTINSLENYARKIFLWNMTEKAIARTALPPKKKMIIW